MTERLSQLMHEETRQLEAPVPDPAGILAQGRRLRRRSRLTTGAAVLAVAAVVAATAGFVALNRDGVGALDPAPTGRSASADRPPAYGVGSEIHLGGVVAQVPDTVHSLHYTSAGVLVRSNPNDGASDGSGPESLTLIDWDGSTTDLGTVPEGVGPATDPTRAVYALAEQDGNGFVAVLRDVETGEAVQEVPLPGLPPSYWDVPPLALDGDTLYVGYRQETVAIDLTTLAEETVADLAGGIPDVAGGRSLSSQEGAIDVKDMTTGENLLHLEFDGYGWGTLSPDGRFLRFMQEETFDQQGNFVEPDLVVYDVTTGEKQEFADPYGWGWTADGRLFQPSGDSLTLCNAASGACEEQPITPALPKNADLRLGGQTYES